MSRVKGPREDFRVVVTPRDMGNFGSISVGRLFYDRTPEGQRRWERDMAERCEEIAQQIKRHVDEVSYCDVEFDQQDECSHCGARWTESSAEYNGGCCQEDQAAEDARAATSEQQS